jgi:hypothetical protein
MAPQINTGLFMTPYNVKMWKANEMNRNGSYMLGFTQMIPIKTKSRFKLHECDVSCRSRK